MSATIWVLVYVVATTKGAATGQIEFWDTKAQCERAKVQLVQGLGDAKAVCLERTEGP